MKTFKTIALVLLLAVSAHARTKVQYEVCAVDPGGKLGVYEVTEKRPRAMAIAEFLNDKAKAKGKYFVVVEEIDDKGDVK